MCNISVNNIVFWKLFSGWYILECGDFF